MKRNKYKELPKTSEKDRRPEREDSSSTPSPNAQEFSQLNEKKRTESLQTPSSTSPKQETSHSTSKDIWTEQPIEKQEQPKQNVSELISRFYPNASPELTQQIKKLLQGSTSNNDRQTFETSNKHRRNDSSDSQQLPVKKKASRIFSDSAHTQDSEEKASEDEDSDSNRTLRAKKSDDDFTLRGINSYDDVTLITNITLTRTQQEIIDTTPNASNQMKDRLTKSFLALNTYLVRNNPAERIKEYLADKLPSKNEEQ